LLSATETLMAETSKQFGPHIQFSFVITDLNIIRLSSDLIEIFSPIRP
jgi:hypothetical protein